MGFEAIQLAQKAVPPPIGVYDAFGYFIFERLGAGVVFAHPQFANDGVLFLRFAGKEHDARRAAGFGDDVGLGGVSERHDSYASVELWRAGEPFGRCPKYSAG